MKSLFLDLDGTLTDISRREIEVIHDTASHFGVSVSIDRDSGIQPSNDQISKV